MKCKSKSDVLFSKAKCFIFYIENTHPFSYTLSMQNPFSEIDKSKTIEEHSNIICTYYKFGTIDREDAIRKFRLFNEKHSDYCAASTTVFRANNSLDSIKNCSNEAIIENLKLQLAFLAGEDYVNNLLKNL